MMQKIDMLHKPAEAISRTIDQSKHDQIASDIAAFIKSCRKITQIPIGASGEFQSVTMREMHEHRYRRANP